MRCVIAVCAVLVGAVLAGCPAADDSDDMPDAPDGKTLGLELTWTMKSPVPGPITSEETIASVHFETQDLRVVGDAGPGDTRTQVSELDLEWTSSVSPSKVMFPDAPAGLYSQVLLRLEGEAGENEAGYEIRGTTMIEGSEVPFTIRDTTSLALAMELSLQLDPAEKGTIDVEIDLHDAIDGVTYSSLPIVDGRRVLGPADAQMPAFRSKLMQAFSAQEATSTQ
ncbi:MAG TPA: hypothetical protein VFQ53_15950 [Kofleriaceae bacterium]|nr:hypothetical protein [Kofleriaceae bacterium]